jgi:hypothetical protein
MMASREEPVVNLNDEDEGFGQIFAVITDVLLTAYSMVFNGISLIQGWFFYIPVIGTYY